VLSPRRFSRRGTVRKVSLASGVLSSLVYVAANALGPLRWKGYSSASQTVSELSAIDAPSRRLVTPLLAAHGALVIPFGWGVWTSAGHDRALRVTGALLMGLGASDLPAPFFPMHQREALGATSPTVASALDAAQRRGSHRRSLKAPLSRRSAPA
jgi:hypothetical protein